MHLPAILIGTPIHLIILAIVQSCGISAMHKIKSFIKCGMIVGAKQAALSIAVTADPLGLSHKTVSSVYTHTKISFKQLFCGQRH